MLEIGREVIAAEQISELDYGTPGEAYHHALAGDHGRIVDRTVVEGRAVYLVRWVITTSACACIGDQFLGANLARRVS